MAWTDTFLEKRRKDWLNKIGKAQYYANGSWRTGVITLKEVQGTNCVIRFATADESELTITQIRLLDTGGDVAFTESRTITKSASQGALIQISVPIVQS